MILRLHYKPRIQYVVPSIVIEFFFKNLKSLTYDFVADKFVVVLALSSILILRES